MAVFDIVVIKKKKKKKREKKKDNQTGHGRAVVLVVAGLYSFESL